MNIEESKITKLKLTDIKRLDPVSVFVDDIEPGKGKITIECYGKSWSSYWGGMSGGTISSFFLSADSDYLANRMWDHSKDQYEPDFDGVQKRVRETVVNWRRENCIEKEFAREIYDIEDWTEYMPQHTYDTWSCPSGVDVVDFESLGMNEYDIPDKPTPAYAYLMRIIDAVRDAFKELSQHQEGEQE